MHSRTPVATLLSRFLPLALIASLAFAWIGTPATADETPDWQNIKIKLPGVNGRYYYASVPVCDPGPCTEPRQLFIYSHGRNGPETQFQVNLWLNNIRSQEPTHDAIWAYALSTGDKDFNAGTDYCCTWDNRDDVGYLVDIRNDLAAKYPVDLNRVGLYGVSNGGMLTAKAACERPDVFPVAVEYAGTPSGDQVCNIGVVNVRQYHGTNDNTVPIEGEAQHIWANGAWRDFVIPPAVAMDDPNRLAPGSSFKVFPITGEDHFPSGEHIGDMIEWLDGQLP